MTMIKIIRPQYILITHRDCLTVYCFWSDPLLWLQICQVRVRESVVTIRVGATIVLPC